MVAILPLMPDLPADAMGYRFLAPVLNVVVLCPSRQLNFGDPAPVAEFVEQRVQWIELLSAATNPTAPALVQALALLLQSEQELPATTSALRARVAGSSQAAEIDGVIAAILISRFRS